MTVVSEQTPAEQTWSALHLFLNEVSSTIFNENLILYNDIHRLIINFISKSYTSIWNPWNYFPSNEAKFV